MRRMYLSAMEKAEVKRIIHDKTGYLIDGSSILNQIFRRSSFAAETGECNNEIFEFIGDQVLSFYVVKIVSEKCGSINPLNGYSFRIMENQFTLIKQALINNETLAKITDDWGIAKYLLLGKSDIKNQASKELKVKADLFEAVIGAIAIKSNWNPQILETAVSKVLKIDEEIEHIISKDSKAKYFDIDNAVTVLKEIAESGQCTMPKYDFFGPDCIGNDKDGNPRWVCSCSIINDTIGLIKQVESTSKKNAKKAAAYLILCEHLDAQNKYGPNDWFNSWTYKDEKLIPNRRTNSKEE